MPENRGKRRGEERKGKEKERREKRRGTEPAAFRPARPHGFRLCCGIRQHAPLPQPGYCCTLSKHFSCHGTTRPASACCGQIRQYTAIHTLSRRRRNPEPFRPFSLSPSGNLCLYNHIFYIPNKKILSALIFCKNVYLCSTKGLSVTCKVTGGCLEAVR